MMSSRTPTPASVKRASSAMLLMPSSSGSSASSTVRSPLARRSRRLPSSAGVALIDHWPSRSSVARRRAGDLRRGARGLVAVDLERLEARADASARRVPGAAELAACAHAARDFLQVLLQLAHVERPRELVGDGAEAAPRGATGGA